MPTLKIKYFYLKCICDEIKYMKIQVCQLRVSLDIMRSMQLFAALLLTIFQASTGFQLSETFGNESIEDGPYGGFIL